MDIKIDDTDVLKVQLLNERLNTCDANLARVQAEQQAAALQLRLSELGAETLRSARSDLADQLRGLSEELERKYGLESEDIIDWNTGIITKRDAAQGASATDRSGATDAAADPAAQHGASSQS